MSLATPSTVQKLQKALQDKAINSNPLICRIDVTGFAGVRVALVALLCLAPLSDWVDLPSDFAYAPIAFHFRQMRGAAREDAAIIVITRDGRWYFNHKAVWVTELREMGSG